MNQPLRSVRLVTVVGCVLVAGSLYTGVPGIEGGWPFACFPTFAVIARDHISQLQIEAFDPDGRIMPTDSESLRDTFADQRLRGLLETALDQPQNGERLRGVWELYVQKAPALHSASDVRFYRALVSTVPADHAVASRDLIAEMGADGSINLN